MLFDKKWIRSLALAMSLPSTTLGVAWFLWHLVGKGIISQNTAVFIFLAIIGNILVSMVVFSIRKK